MPAARPRPRRAGPVPLTLAAVAGLILALCVAVLAPTAAFASEASAASLAAANMHKTAGTCAANPTHNSLGGDQFESSCSGYAGHPEYWCADFAKWVWRHSGLNIDGLTAAAQSFYTYGQSHGSFRSKPVAGDAMVFASSPSGYAHHVGIITAVHSDGSITVANGDFGGQSGSETTFATTSEVKPATISSRSSWVGSWASTEGYYIKAIVAPSGSGGSAPPPSSGNPYSASGVCGSGYGVVDSHTLSGATVFLLYNGGNGDNCVVTLANADKGAKSMNATLAVQGGTSGSDPGSYHWYAGPIRKHAPDSCVKWGGTYGSSTWTSGWGHCGSGPASTPTQQNPYSPEQACGSGYFVIDQHKVGGAEAYLLYNNSTGKNCVATMASDVGGAVSMSATLHVQNGASASDSGSYTYYAGPVKLSAPDRCVKWGGSYKSHSWTSNYGHCGSGSSSSSPNPYTATQVCGSGYSVIDSHNLGPATVYLLYSGGTGKNCVATMVHSGSGSVGLNATLHVQGGASASNPGLFEWYAGPVRLSAAGKCVKWGGSYDSTSWTSAYSHCG